MSTTESEKRLDLPGTYNLRDVGGYPAANGRQTRWHTLLRSDSLHRLTPTGITTLARMGLRTVVDLRQAEERNELPSAFATHPEVRYVAVPLFPTSMPGKRATGLGELYRLILDQAQPQFRQVVSALSAVDALPALVHCHAGKDRTGLVIAVLLALAGVPASLIASDYALSGRYLTDEFYAEMRQQMIAAGRSWETMQPFLVSPAELMLATLTYLEERYGGPQLYLEQVGISTAQLVALRDAITE